MTIEQKLSILTDSAKYDVSCSSSGSVRTLDFGGVGSVGNGGICHAYSADGRCISLLKILFTNYCLYDCAYCVNRISNDIRRAVFTPEEVAQLTINFYRRNMIEGLFLSSGIITSEDHTMRLILKTLQLLRHAYGFNGYIHVKLIPGASEELIIGATPESDLDILRLSTSLYDKAMLKRVYYSAYIPINNVKNLPSLGTPPPLLREHRLYQADWLIRFYGFGYDEIVDEDAPNLDERFDPKLAWALRNLHLFPIELNRADKETLLRIPGLGGTGCQ
jgi:predicted DNA-binding helix-hairpin-helix protein